MHSSWHLLIFTNASKATGKVTEMTWSLIWIWKDLLITDCGTTTDGRSSPTPWTIILLVCLVFEGLLFAIFTLIMFGVQIQAIWNDETGIEQLKKETGRWHKQTSWKSFRVVFGKGFSLSWFSPFTRVAIGGRVEPSYSYSYSVWYIIPLLVS